MSYTLTKTCKHCGWNTAFVPFIVCPVCGIKNESRE